MASMAYHGQVIKTILQQKLHVYDFRLFEPLMPVNYTGIFRFSCCNPRKDFILRTESRNLGTQTSAQFAGIFCLPVTSLRASELSLFIVNWLVIRVAKFFGTLSPYSRMSGISLSNIEKISSHTFSSSAGGRGWLFSFSFGRNRSE